MVLWRRKKKKVKKPEPVALRSGDGSPVRVSSEPIPILSAKLGRIDQKAAPARYWLALKKTVALRQRRCDAD